MSDSIGPHPSLADTIRKAAELAMIDVRVAIPARVEKVDLQHALIDAKPLVKEVVRDAEDDRQALSVPVVSNIPVIFPGAGGMRVTFPLKRGDTVLLLFADRSLDSWLVGGGEVDPIDDRRHHLTDAVAIPGLKDFGHPWKGIDDSAVTIGEDGASQHPAALGDAVRDELDALWDAVYGGHVHPGVEPGGGSTGTATGSASKETVESATVKITA
jgi:hypothetical protein